MLYIHRLNQLNQKSADLESVSIIRELKQKTPPPLDERQVIGIIENFLTSDSDKALVEASLPSIESALAIAARLVEQKDKVHENANCIRTAQILRDLPLPIQNSLLYIYDISNWQKGFVLELVPLLNGLSNLRTADQKSQANRQLQAIFRKILRGDEFVYHYPDLVNEREIAAVDGLLESLNKGFLFHYTLEEELKKTPFDELKRKIPYSYLNEAEQLRLYVVDIKRGVDRAQQVNMKMINLAVVLYSYVKWLTSPI